MSMHKHPEWLDNAVFYEIYPQSFLDTNGDGIGDFEGIIRKLDYVKSLGCNAIWLNPCFESSFFDAGYDVTDFYTAAPRYGTNADLKRLFDELHKRDMHIFLDLVPGHTSVMHPWFQESLKPEKNAYTDRYVWTDRAWNCPQCSGINGYLRGISDRDAACAVNYYSTQPALNYGFYIQDEPWQQPMDAPGPRATIEEMKNIFRFWFGLGCDGFRVDMAGSLVKNDPEQKGTIKLWQEIRAFVDEEFPDKAIVSEWGEPDKSLQGGFHMDFLLHFGPSHYNDLFRCEEPYFTRRAKGNIHDFIDAYLNFRQKSGEGGLICIPCGNHDIDRLARRMDDGERRVAFAFLLSVPGVPFLYYGEEIGMRFLENLPSKEGGYERTGTRSPMQWDDSTNAGFSAAPSDKIYIPIDPDKNRPTVEKAMADEGSLWHEIRKLIEVRKAHPALDNQGDIEFLQVGYPLVYRRTSGDEKITVIINVADAPAEIQVNGTLLHKVGGDVTIENGVCKVAGCTAAYIME